MTAHCGERVVGVDVGGTFTDLFLLDVASGTFRVAKVPSQRGDEASGFLAGLAALGLEPRAAARTEPNAVVVHGTTVGTNALLERKGARVGVITTRGFRDVLEMRRRDRPHTWGLWGQFEPIAARDLRIEVGERTLASGEVRQAIDDHEVTAAARLLLERGAEALAIIFINSYRNSSNETRAEQVARCVWPNAFVSRSSAVLPEFREFERASTTALNAYLQPLLGSYLGRLEQALQALPGTANELHVVQSNGGIMSSTGARRWPVRTALSGPAAGVMAALAIGRAAGHANLITCDLGGTSFDVSLVAAGEAVQSAQATIDFGLVVRTPMVEITTIGAGGGSIARVDAGGLLEVGPRSAGSRPGPACYGLGNQEPTLTDANLLLGRINAESPIGGQFEQLDRDAAARAVERAVGQPLRLDVTAAAQAIVRVADARMAGAVRLVSVERGYDPREFVAMPFGGGGALHACALINEVGLRAALVPRFPGVTSALGCVIADTRHDQVQTLNLPLAALDEAALGEAMQASARATAEVALSTGLPLDGCRVAFALDMHYLGQTHSVRVPLAEWALAPDPQQATDNLERAPPRTQDIQRAFEQAYHAAFGRTLQGHAVRVVSLHTQATGLRPALDLALLAPPAGGRVDAALTGRREVWFGDGWQATPVYARLELPAACAIDGPAVLEQADATVLIEPGHRGRVDALGNLFIEAAP